jgi:2-polyprenyl-3-methyl-5-hydroxy-6-metoxy-1,4-benzoquinol methylase
MTDTRYSKPASDVAGHTARLVADNTELLARQTAIAAQLQGCPPRTHCLLCANSLLQAFQFSHRGIAYLACDVCNHIQCGVMAPEGYPGAAQDFADIYRPLDTDAYEARTRTIYLPKAQWALQAAEKQGLGDLSQRSWLEFGAGAGSFLHALTLSGAKQVTGIEAEQTLVAQAAAALGAPLVRHFTGTLAEAARQNSADIYVAWFVLEHCFSLGEFFAAMRGKPKGTLFLFSVPTFGFAALLECAAGAHYSRHLDSVLHLQLFTDESIRYALAGAGYEIAAEWIFGQDADDLHRFISAGVKDKMPPALLARESRRLQIALDGIQTAIDHARLADARHILAVKQ